MADGQKAAKRARVKPANAPSPHVRPPRAPYATDPSSSRGRLYPEPESRTRNPFERDRDRIVHASAFRRRTFFYAADERRHHRHAVENKYQHEQDHCQDQVKAGAGKNDGKTLKQTLVGTGPFPVSWTYPPKGNALKAYSVSPLLRTKSFGPKPTEKVSTPTPDNFANKK